MDRESLFKFARYGLYTVLGIGLFYVLIPMELPILKPSVLEIALQQLTVLTVVTLFVERSLEVYKLFSFSSEKERLTAQVESARAEQQGGDVTAQGERRSLLELEEKLQAYKNHIRQSLLRASIVFGVLMGLVGVRSLEAAFNFPVPASAIETFRLYLFRVLDVVLTAGLIAGGSEGIHNITKQLNGLFAGIPEKIIDVIRTIRKASV